ncbi:MAG: ATP-binding protein [Rhodocyclaceae bacterium]
MSGHKAERWHRKLASLNVTHAGNPLLAELEALLGNFSRLERRLEKIASISDKLQSDMIRLKEELGAGGMRFRMLAENMTDVVWTLDSDTLRVTYISPSIQKLRGYTPDEIIAEPVDSPVDAVGRKKFHALMAQRTADARDGVLPLDNAFIDELEQTRKDGSRVWTEIVSRYLLDAQSGTIEIHGVTRDISKRKRIENRLFLTIKELEHAEAEQRQLLSVASHEFRTPAAMIKASLDSLAILKDRIPPEVAQRLGNIGQASLRLNKLANNLISHDRLQELALKPKKQAADLCQLVREVSNKYPAENALQLELPDYPVILNADTALLGIALHNLIDNALRYHAGADQPLRISLTESGESTEHTLEIRVYDQGPGIADSEKEKIFQRFYSTKGSQSDGLGLSIVHSVARAHGGISFVVDNVPQGAVFTIKLPGNRADALSF